MLNEIIPHFECFLNLAENLEYNIKTLSLFEIIFVWKLQEGLWIRLKIAEN